MFGVIVCSCWFSCGRHFGIVCLLLFVVVRNSAKNLVLAFFAFLSVSANPFGSRLCVRSRYLSSLLRCTLISHSKCRRASITIGDRSQTVFETAKVTFFQRLVEQPLANRNALTVIYFFRFAFSLSHLTNLAFFEFTNNRGKLNIL